MRMADEAHLDPQVNVSPEKRVIAAAVASVAGASECATCGRGNLFRLIKCEGADADGQAVDRRVRGVFRPAAAGGRGVGSGGVGGRPGPGDWSILELVIHLTDSDCIAIDRMKRMLTEDEPPLLYADETAYVRQLATHEQSLEDALILVRGGAEAICTRITRPAGRGV